MDTATIIACVVGAFVAAAHLAIDGGIGKLIDWAFAAIGLQSGKGPQLAKSAWQGERLAIALRNQGRHRMRLAGIQGTDGGRKLVFPRPRLEKNGNGGDSVEEAFRDFSKMEIEPGETRVIFLERSELLEMDCRALAIIDSNARIWPVADYGLGEGS